MSWWNVASLRIWRTFISGPFCASMESPLSLSSDSLTEPFSHTKYSFPSIWFLFASLAVGVRILSQPSTKISLSRPSSKNNTQHHPLHFPCSIFFSWRWFFSESREENFRCAPFEWKKSFFWERTKTHFQKRRRKKKTWKHRNSILKCSSRMQLTSLHNRRESIRIGEELVLKFPRLRCLYFI